jgi:transcriptional regulator
MPPRDWRVGSDYDHVEELGLTGLAWEFLRRNPQYQSDYLAATRGVGGRDAPGSGGGLPPRWGLRFPGGPGAGRARNGLLLAA